MRWGEAITRRHGDVGSSIVGAGQPVLTPMADTQDQDTIHLDSVEDQVGLVAMNARPLPQFEALARSQWKFREKREGAVQTVTIGDGLIDAKILDRVGGNAREIVVGCS